MAGGVARDGSRCGAASPSSCLMKPARSSTEFSQMESNPARSASTDIFFNSGQLLVTNCESVSLDKRAVRMNAERICVALYSSEPRLQASESSLAMRGEMMGLREFPDLMRSRARVRSLEIREESISKWR